MCEDSTKTKEQCKDVLEQTFISPEHGDSSYYYFQVSLPSMESPNTFHNEHFCTESIVITTSDLLGNEILYQNLTPIIESSTTVDQTDQSLTGSEENSNVSSENGSDAEQEGRESQRRSGTFAAKKR